MGYSGGLFYFLVDRLLVFVALSDFGVLPFFLEGVGSGRTISLNTTAVLAGRYNSTYS
jgi:hypothetical protein